MSTTSKPSSPAPPTAQAAAPETQATQSSPAVEQNQGPPNEETSTAAVAPPATLTPFFTLIHDTQTNNTLHPSQTHYLFSDDDTSLLSTTISQSLQNPSSSERILILDLNETGSSVLKAQSLSADWQITNTDIGVAPSFEGGDGEGMLLSIEGVGIQEERDVDDTGVVGEEEMRLLVEGFEERMGVLRGLIGKEVEREKGKEKVKEEEREGDN